MNEVHIVKAQGVGDQTVPSVCIVIDQEVSNQADEGFYESQATELHEALLALPGAVYDRLLIRMLEKTKSSLIVVPRLFR